MKPSLLLTSLTGALLLSPVGALAMPQQGPPDRPNHHRAGRAELGLTDVQKADIQKAVESARRDRLRKSTDLRIAKMDLQSLLRADKVDEKAVAAKLAEAQAAQSTLMKLRIDTALAMKRILTPEQHRKMSEMRASRGRPMGHKMKMRGMKGRGAGRMGPPMGHGAPRGLEGPGELEPEVDRDHGVDLPAEPPVSR